MASKQPRLYKRPKPGRIFTGCPERYSPLKTTVFHRLKPAVSYPGALFVERSMLPCSGPRRIVVVPTLGMAAITASLVWWLFLDFAMDEWAIVAGAAVFGGVSAALMSGIFAVALWCGSRWPIAIESGPDGPVVRLLNRQEWAKLEDLEPSIVSAPFEYCYPAKHQAQGFSIPKSLLPFPIRDDRFAVWLLLQSFSRPRWVLLQATQTHDEAVLAADDWMKQLNSSALSDDDPDQPPEKVAFADLFKISLFGARRSVVE
ncbi:MAG: hypothetical protein AB8F26_06690 [Phycisphaerales bacterium]